MLSALGTYCRLSLLIGSTSLTTFLYRQLDQRRPKTPVNMPLWRIYAHPSTFTNDQKAGLAAAITKLYTSPPNGLPAFYVNVLFIPLEEDEIWVGGEIRKNFVRITVEQIARTMASSDTEEGRARRKWWMDKINEVGFESEESSETMLMLTAGPEALDRGSS